MLIQKILQRIGYRSLLQALLLIGAAATVTAGMIEMVPRIDPRTMWVMSMLGLGAGWLLARSRLNPWLAGFLGLCFGSLLIVYILAELSNPLVAMLRGLTSMIFNPLDGKQGVSPDNAPVLLAFKELTTRLTLLVMNLRIWLNSFYNESPGIDPLSLTLLWGVLIWCCTLWAAWWIYRLKQPLAAIVPMAGILAGMLNYTRYNPILMVPLVAITLGLLALVQLQKEHLGWIKRKVDYAEDIVLDFSLTAFFLILMLTSVAAAAPSISIPQAVRLGSEVFQRYQGETNQVAESLGISQQEQYRHMDSLVSQGLPRQHLLGTGVELSERIVMTIQVDKLMSSSNQEIADKQGQAVYWRGITFDRYTGQGWESSPTLKYVYQAGETAYEELPVSNQAQQIVDQQVNFVQDLGGLIYGAGELVSVNQPYKVAWRLPIEQGADAFGATIETTSYQAQSLVTFPSQSQLERASSEYPTWITKRYLQLPEYLPERVYRLARELVEGAEVTYQKAQSIEAYLRSYPYSLDVPTPPDDQDVVDYFLFDLQKGYCDYYASAMVVLARINGVPARLAVGYATGSYDPINERYVVSEAEAHSWAEVFFSGIGWIPFEPTAGRPAIERPSEDSAPITLNNLKPSRGFSLVEWVRSFTWQGWLKIGGWSLVIIVLLWMISDLPRLRRMTPSSAIGQLYDRLRRRSQRLAATMDGDTPYQFITRIQQRINALPDIGYTLLAPILPDIQRLADLYIGAAYSPHPPNRVKRSVAIQSWKNIRTRLWLADAWLRIFARNKPSE